MLFKNLPIKSNLHKQREKMPSFLIKGRSSMQNQEMNQSHESAVQNTPQLPFSLISRDDLQRLSWEEKLSDAEIASLYHVTANEVNRKRRQMNLMQGQITSEQLSEVVRLAENIKRLPMEAIEEIRAVVDKYMSKKM